MRPTVEVEVRKCQVREWSGVSKKTGMRQVYHVLEIGAECVADGAPIILSQFLPDGATVQNTVIPFTKGDHVRFVLNSLQERGGVLNARFTQAEILKTAYDQVKKN
jgi:hypothetical protein